jgi:uncharacterized membrane protein YidH (DUF202 family)
VDTSTPRTSAYLIVVGVSLAVLGMVLVALSAPDASVPGDTGSLLGAWLGGVASLAGFVASMAGLLRWARTTRRTTVRVADRPRTAAAA